MQKVMIIGCPGSGKSTFSRALQEVTQLPLYHLDMLYWNEDRTEVERDVFVDRIQDVIEGEQWIIDGNYASTIEMRLKACDTVFFLDYPLAICLEGVEARKGKARSDMPWIQAVDEEDEALMVFMNNYRTVNRPVVLELLNTYADKQIIVFNNRQEASYYLEAMK